MWWWYCCYVDCSDSAAYDDDSCGDKGWLLIEIITTCMIAVIVVTIATA